MNCKISNDKLIELLLDELSTEEKSTLQNHINTCSYCQSQLKELNQLQHIWDNPIYYLNDSFTDMIMANVTKTGYLKSKRSSYKHELIHFALAATATIALFATGVFDHYFYALNEYGINFAKGTNEFYLLFTKGTLWLDSLQLQIINSLQLF